MAIVNPSASETMGAAMSNTNTLGAQRRAPHGLLSTSTPLHDAAPNTDVQPKLSISDIRTNLAAYRAHPKIGFKILAQYTDMCTDPDIAVVLTECATAVGRFDVAELAILFATDPHGLLHAQMLLLQNHPVAALAALKGRPDDALHLARYFGLRIGANTKTGHYDAAVLAAEDWFREISNSPMPFNVLAKMLAEHDDPRAETWFMRALTVSGGDTDILLDLAEFLVRTDKPEIARDHLNSLKQGSALQEHRKFALNIKITACCGPQTPPEREIEHTTWPHSACAV